MILNHRAGIMTAFLTKQKWSIISITFHAYLFLFILSLICSHGLSIPSQPFISRRGTALVLPRPIHDLLQSDFDTFDSPDAHVTDHDGTILHSSANPSAVEAMSPATVVVRQTRNVSTPYRLSHLRKSILWDYTDESQLHWSDSTAMCGSVHQSPIHIYTNETFRYTPEIPYPLVDELYVNDDLIDYFDIFRTILGNTTTSTTTAPGRSLPEGISVRRANHTRSSRLPPSLEGSGGGVGLTEMMPYQLLQQFQQHLYVDITNAGYQILIKPIPVYYNTRTGEIVDDIVRYHVSGVVPSDSRPLIDRWRERSERLPSGHDIAGGSNQPSTESGMDTIHADSNHRFNTTSIEEDLHLDDDPFFDDLVELLPNLMTGYPLHPDGVYSLHSMHFHSPAEHMIDSHQYAIELHVVYKLVDTDTTESIIGGTLHPRNEPPAEPTAPDTVEAARNGDSRDHHRNTASHSTQSTPLPRRRTEISTLSYDFIENEQHRSIGELLRQKYRENEQHTTNQSEVASPVDLHHEGAVVMRPIRKRAHNGVVPTQGGHEQDDQYHRAPELQPALEPEPHSGGEVQPLMIQTHSNYAPMHYHGYPTYPHANSPHMASIPHIPQGLHETYSSLSSLSFNLPSFTPFSSPSFYPSTMHHHGYNAFYNYDSHMAQLFYTQQFMAGKGHQHMPYASYQQPPVQGGYPSRYALHTPQPHYQDAFLKSFSPQEVPAPRPLPSGQADNQIRVIDISPDTLLPQKNKVKPSPIPPADHDPEWWTNGIDVDRIDRDEHHGHHYHNDLSPKQSPEHERGREDHHHHHHDGRKPPFFDDVADIPIHRDGDIHSADDSSDKHHWDGSHDHEPHPPLPPQPQPQPQPPSPQPRPSDTPPSTTSSKPPTFSKKPTRLAVVAYFFQPRPGCQNSFLATLRSTLKRSRTPDMTDAQFRRLWTRVNRGLNETIYGTPFHDDHPHLHLNPDNTIERALPHGTGENVRQADDVGAASDVLGYVHGRLNMKNLLYPYNYEGLIPTTVSDEFDIEGDTSRETELYTTRCYAPTPYHWFDQPTSPATHNGRRGATSADTMDYHGHHPDDGSSRHPLPDPHSSRHHDHSRPVTPLSVLAAGEDSPAIATQAGHEVHLCGLSDILKPDDNDPRQYIRRYLKEQREKGGFLLPDHDNEDELTAALRRKKLLSQRRPHRVTVQDAREQTRRHRQLRSILDQSHLGVDEKVIFYDEPGLPISIGTGHKYYYGYFGSLTTIPCDEDVTWIVGAAPLYADPDDIRFFSELAVNNNRRLQPTNNRTVVAVDLSENIVRVDVSYQQVEMTTEVIDLDSDSDFFSSEAPATTGIMEPSRADARDTPVPPTISP